MGWKGSSGDMYNTFNMKIFLLVFTLYKYNLAKEVATNMTK